MKLNKIINDPVHGFIEIPRGTVMDLIDTRAFQRLRRIHQLALSSLVYPGAVHTRFNHALGAMALMRQALNVLRSKAVAISDEEYEATLIAILLHDIGHSPFSHALESIILEGLHHERMSLAIMRYLNEKMDGQLDLALDIFSGNYHRPFLTQLVSSQLDMDRMDYLKRDSYFTGVVEGLVSADRIIKTLNVHQNRLVVEAKGIYSVEKFIVARRLMYWQVYLHRAVLAAEFMIVNILRRARTLLQAGETLWSSPLLDFLFSLKTSNPLDIPRDTLESFLELDDTDILYAVKQWRSSKDKVLSLLCRNLLRRRLIKARLKDQPYSDDLVEKHKQSAMEILGISEQEAGYLVFKGEVSNSAYLRNSEEQIDILGKDGSIKDLIDASDMSGLHAYSVPVKKYYLCFPEWESFGKSL